MLSKIVRVCGGAFLLSFSLKLFGIGFLMFPLCDNMGNLIYSDEDVRIRARIAPFPLIFHYNGGGDTSEYPFSRIIKKFTLEEIPDLLYAFLVEQSIDPEQIQCFEAWCVPLHPTMNYFTHLWAMDKMVENREVLVASGMFDPINLSSISGEIGVNAVVTQNMHFHDSKYLSGNCARFQMNNPNEPAKAWFVSIYDPSVNVGKNADVNQIKRAIAVYWHFIPWTQDQVSDESLSGEIINIYAQDDEPIKTLRPQFVPQK